MSLILVTLLVFHVEMSGNDDNDLHFLNILLIDLNLFVFHLEMSGNDIKDLQPENI